MLRFADCNASFTHALQRAREMVKLFDALSLIAIREANDDALRAAYFQAVSSFDFYLHEILAVEARHRFENNISTRNILIPMDVAIISDSDSRTEAADVAYRIQNSYKSFVDPQKLSDAFSCFTNDPLTLIQNQHNAIHAVQADKADLKIQLKSLWKRRNKIAHEADINPTLAGIGLWPIDKADTELTIDFLERLGACLPSVISSPL